MDWTVTSKKRVREQSKKSPSPHVRRNEDVCVCSYYMCDNYHVANHSTPTVPF